MILRKGLMVAIPASYCEAGGVCTESNPCRDCFDMCNVFVLDADVQASYETEVNGLRSKLYEGNHD